jgi:hypothetical protein
MSVLEDYSGIIVNQNAVPGPADFYALTSGQVYQEFFLPTDIARGTTTDERRSPPLSGFQLAVNVPVNEQAAGFDWVLEYQVFGVGWIRLDEGTAVGCHTYGTRVWMNAYFNKPISVDAGFLGSRFRIGIVGRNAVAGAAYRQPVDYDGSRAIVNGNAVSVKLTPDKPYPFILGGVPSVLIYESAAKQAYYSVQQGPTAIWYTTPNPLAESTASARQANGTTQLGNFSFLFRILALSADEGTDFLGNRYRSVVVKQDPNNVSTRDGQVKDKYWLSKPNPSRFAVEALYFDVRAPAPQSYDKTSGVPNGPAILDVSAVIDRVLVDPLTPGMYFHVYYTEDGDVATTQEEWDRKLWKVSPRTFHATKREAHVLPEPIRAKFVKIEFSHLQAKHYAPGDFAKPVTYRKHPKWVLDYFLARLESEQNTQETQLGIRRVGVVFDALDIAYNYYLDDLAREPDKPVELVNSAVVPVGPFVDQVDSDTLNRINLSMQPYRDNPAMWGKNDYILTQQAQENLGVAYPTEGGSLTATQVEIQSLRNREVAFENDYPVMYFYLTCRHGYREVTAAFSHDRAYFAGINEIAFTRERYTQAHDNTQYIEPGADLLNMERNDFVNDGGGLVVAKEDVAPVFVDGVEVT